MACVDAPDVYFVPLNLRDEGFDQLVIEKLDLKAGPLDLSEWNEVVDRIHAKSGSVCIAIVGKYVQLQDAYLSVVEALRHGGLFHGRDVEIVWVDAETLRPDEIERQLQLADGILVPGGFGIRGIEGKILAVKHARENGIPYLGICLGMQVAVVEYARHMCGMAGANSSEFDPETPFPVIDLLPEQKDVEDMGGTMRLGASPVKVVEGTRTYAAYGDGVVYERHRHRFEVNNVYRGQLVDAGLVVSGMTPDERLVEIIELTDHPFFVASQFHPEFKSRPTRPQPLFRDFVGAAIACDCSGRGAERAAAAGGASNGDGGRAARRWWWESRPRSPSDRAGCRARAGGRSRPTLNA